MAESHIECTFENNKIDLDQQRSAGMKVIEPGHVYELDQLDGDGRPLRLVFVNREQTPHAGTQTQEVLRMQIDIIDTLVDRTNHCDACLSSVFDPMIVKALTEAQRQLRLALLHHEQRAIGQKAFRGVPIDVWPTGLDGHLEIRGSDV
jgi:hypothetical protein